MLISELPIEIQEVIFQRQTEQGNKPNNQLMLGDDKNQGNFTWNETKEGYDFWSIIYRDNIEYFYTLYPKSSEPNYEIY